MATTKDDISRWFNDGLEQGPTHLIVVCDTFDYQDYPVYVHKPDDVMERVRDINKQSMQKVMEVYSYSLDLQSQLNEHRAFNVLVDPLGPTE